MVQGHLRGIGFAVCAACCYGLIPSIAKFAFIAGVPALESAVFRTVVIFVVMGVFGWMLGQGFRIPQVARRAFALQVCATLVVSACYIASLEFIPVSVSVLVFFTFPVLVMLASPLVEGRRISFLRIALSLLAFAGLAVAIGPDAGRLDWRGLALAFASAVGCATQFFAGRKLAGKIGPAPLASLVHALVLPFLVLIMQYYGGGEMRLLSGELPFTALMAVGLFGLLYSAAYFFQMSSVAHAPASAVTPFFNIEPVIASLAAVVIVGEHLSIRHVFGGAMVLAALMAMTWVQGRDGHERKT